ncbi:MAG TPA: hypothetical protein VIO32_06075 [Candidatus Baltobacteraceae bacterium]
MKRTTIFSCTLLLFLSLITAAVRADSYTGTWSIEPGDKPGYVQLDMRWHGTDRNGEHSWENGEDVPAPQVHDGAFAITEDAGVFHAQGTFSGQTGGGTWTFVPNPQFGAQLERRGLSAPSDDDVFRLAMAHFQLRSLDALLAAGFARPSVEDLVRLGEHGVTDRYIAATKGLDFQPKTVESLIRLRDHGVSTAYMHALWSLGYHPSAQELVRLRDHGVTAAFIQRLRTHGYTRLTADDLIRLRDHGF